MRRNNIVILGSRGMLGQMVKKYFSNNDFNVTIFDDRFKEENHHEFIGRLNRFPDSIVINCIGKIKQKTTEANELFLSNTILPLEFTRSLRSQHILIHPSTDCVFDGLKDRSYNFNHPHTAKDVYGWSKSLGESAVFARPNSLIIRVSIIGPDKYSTKGLLSWFLNNPAKSEINGYTDHFWNGITTLEWCKRLHDIIKSESRLMDLTQKKIIQLGTNEVYSKYEMLKIFQQTFNTDFIINPFEAQAINRCLTPLIVSKSLEFQLIELKEYYYTL